MRRLAAVAAVAVLLTAGCGADGGPERVVRVDFQHDEFASSYWRFFPRKISALPGDTVLFRQEWTGEPHNVTMGRLVDRALTRLSAVERSYADLGDDASPEAVAEAEAAMEAALEGLPTLRPTDPGALDASLPCYLATGRPPADPGTPCPPSARRQPPFDGTFEFYSSGFIPPQDPSGNTYRVRLDDDIDPGVYRFYCTIHFPWMQGELEVEEPGSVLPSAEHVQARTREEIEILAGPLRKAFEQARSGEARYRRHGLNLPLAGYHSPEEFTVAINEFIPRTITARTNEPITWTMVGAHTISFDVPEYIPIYFVTEDGAVRRNPKVDRAAGGAPDAPAVTFDAGPFRLDGGTWDGEGFFSSGLVASEPYLTYTLRVSKPGRYRYACLVHPKMVGTLVVRD